MMTIRLRGSCLSGSNHRHMEVGTQASIDNLHHISMRMLNEKQDIVNTIG